MSFTATYTGKATTQETRTLASTPAASSSTEKFSHDAFDLIQAFTATSSPPITKFAAFEVTISGGAVEIDLTSLTGTDGDAVDGSGLRVQALLLKGKSTNAAPIVAFISASLGYDGLGADYLENVAPGGANLTFCNEPPGEDIGASYSKLTMSGTNDDVLQVAVALG